MQISQAREARLSELNNQMWQAGVTGMLRGSIFALVSGVFFNYKYNHGHNVRFFNTPYKVWWFISCNVVGIIFTTDIAKHKISQQVAVEDEIRRNEYLQNEVYRK
ncbi:uncharacterized protein CANTADRAFT_51151 [Suhomyces tanzawaensis NRRL Y-17324]|uniref:Uncharacterized protein n=1 Tax=Suhomyces tanzawaensis NRRL Y-17324 TaxID=984487 RepID=A0A1E4SI28_9ASCO|nr:uncharacterized protein CANTADRAFT_51151 [Suhomyces tanzawaensis NRRL Y-17324]ODV79169.1 hypothetical protein CANTADRAFT_51151 [Suhomyces tanzawaensis NRRL Y-17324]